MSSQLERFRELEKKATKGPWIAQDNLVGGHKWPASMVTICHTPFDISRPDDMELIALMRNNLGKLLAVCDAAKEFQPWETQKDWNLWQSRLDAMRDALAELEKG